MADVSIKQLATLVNKTPELLLEQLKEAGVSVTDVEQTINDEEKRRLLLYLKNLHGADENKRSPITLQRKKMSVVKQGKKNVSVEIRQKRTFVKPVTPKEVIPKADRKSVV